MSLSIGLLVMIALFGAFGGAEAPARNAQAPATSESAKAAELLDKFPGSDQQSVLIVASRSDGGELTAADTEALRALAPILFEADDTNGAKAPNDTADTTSAAEQPARAPEPMLSDDGEAAVLVTPIDVGESNTETAGAIKALRSQLADHTSAGLQLQVTGGPAFGADIAASFEGADFTLLLVTILIVALLLGSITAVFGGVTRDVLCNEIPTVYRDHRPYTLCTLIGGALFIALDQFGVTPHLSTLVGICSIAGLRLLALACQWRIPAWPRDTP